jgi:multidrug efflux pump
MCWSAAERRERLSRCGDHRGEERRWPARGQAHQHRDPGKEIEGLLDEAEKREEAFIESKNVPGVEALRIDIDRAKPEMPITIDREKARRLNVSTYAVADAIRTALFGKEVSTFRMEGDDDDYEINVRLKDAYRYDVQQLMDMKVTFRDMLTGRSARYPSAPWPRRSTAPPSAPSSARTWTAWSP